MKDGQPYSIPEIVASVAERTGAAQYIASIDRSNFSGWDRNANPDQPTARIFLSAGRDVFDPNELNQALRSLMKTLSLDTHLEQRIKSGEMRYGSWCQAGYNFEDKNPGHLLLPYQDLAETYSANGQPEENTTRITVVPSVPLGLLAVTYAEMQHTRVEARRFPLTGQTLGVYEGYLDHYEVDRLQKFPGDIQSLANQVMVGYQVPGNRVTVALDQKTVYNYAYYLKEMGSLY